MIRRSAYWMCQLDERILAHLRREGWSSPEIMLSRAGFENATKDILRWRCRCLADVDLLDFTGGDTVELTQEGAEYLEGDFRADLRRNPRRSRSIGIGWNHSTVDGHEPSESVSLTLSANR